MRPPERTAEETATWLRGQVQAVQRSLEAVRSQQVGLNDHYTALLENASEEEGRIIQENWKDANWRLLETVKRLEQQASNYRTVLQYLTGEVWS